MVVAVAVLLAGCSGGSSDSSSSTAVPEVVTTVAVTEVVTTVPADVEVTATVPVPAVDSALAELPAGPGRTVEVDSGPVPATVSEAIEAGGGVMSTTATWEALADLAGLPVVTGDGVKLVAATQTVAAIGAGFHRTDELQWLFSDRAGKGVAGLLDEVAVAAGVITWPVSAQQSTVAGAACTERTYESGDVVWELSGCDYERYRPMVAIGVSRRGDFATGTAYSVPSVFALVDATGASVGSSSIEFVSEPRNGLNLFVDLELFPPAGSTADEMLSRARTALVGWKELGGEESSLFTSLTESWAVGATVLRFHAESRMPG